MGVTRLINLIKKLEDFEANKMEAILEKAIDEKADRMVELNLDQLEAGIDNKGKSIDPPYTPYTVAQKIRKGQIYDHVTLKDKGDFYNKFEAQKYKGKVEIVSNDIKEEALKRKYGDDIEGLTDQNLDIVRDEMKPIISKEIKKFFRV